MKQQLGSPKRPLREYGIILIKMLLFLACVTLLVCGSIKPIKKICTLHERKIIKLKQ